jgi:hypothetical protein
MPAPPPTDAGPLAEPVPPGWPGDDPTVPDELGLLGGRPRRPRSSDDVGPEPRRRRRADTGPHPGRRSGVAHDGGPGTGATSRADVDTSHDGHDEPFEADADEGPHGEIAVGDGDDLVAGVQPAGRALVVMVVALVLAMLVNADALVERAERRAPGAQRDRALAVWYPVQDVSHVLQLHRIRELADWAAGDDDGEVAAPAPGRGSRDRGAGSRGPGGAADAGDDEAAGTSDTPAGAGELRTPTEDDPLRLWVGGDFMAQLLGESLLASAEPTGLIDPVLHYESASGLTRSDYYDWPDALGRDLDDHDAEVVVVMLGVNDGQGIMLADGTPVPAVDDPRWAPEYRRRVGALMDQLRAPGRLVVWIGQPPMRDPDLAASITVVNQAYADEAASRPWVTHVDAAAVLGGPGGTYAESLPAGPDGGGTAVDVRQPDGIHLTPAGGERLAAEVMAVIDAAVDLPG